MNRASILLSVAWVLPAVAADSIGFAYADGSYRVDGTTVHGNVTLFRGATLEVGDAPAKLYLQDGARVWLAKGSRAALLPSGALLTRGAGQYEGPAGWRLEARGIRVIASAPGTVVRVVIDEAPGAIVAPLRGAVEVMSSRGVRVGALAPGAAVRYTDQQGQSADVRVSGCIYRDGKQLALTDRITNVAVQLTGPGLERQVGQAVDITGVQGATASEVIVRQLERSAATCAAGIPSRRAPLLLASAAGPQQGQAGPTRLNLVIVEGEGAINNIRQRTAREPIVEVQDENHRPVAGALVLFELPRSGPSGTFANNTTSLQVVTDQNGRAIAHGMKPNEQAGEVQIAVTATYGVLSATTTIVQTNLIAATAAATAAGVAAAGAGEAGARASSGAAGPGAADAAAPGAPSGAAGAGAGTAGGTAGGTAAGAGKVSGTGAGSQGAGAAAHAGIGAATKATIIGGVAASAVVGGLAAGGVIFGGSGAQPAASR